MLSLHLVNVPINLLPPCEGLPDYTLHLAANPLKYIPNIEASKDFNFVRKPEVKPDNTSPVPPTVIAGVFC